MTKSDITYASVPTSFSEPEQPQPSVQGFEVGSSHAVTVIVDSNNPNNGVNPDHSAIRRTKVFLDGRRKPVQLTMCPMCAEKLVRTRTKTFPSAVTWTSVVVGALVFFPLCWIPLVMDSMKETDHYCQSCGAKIGTIKALEGCFVKERM